MVPPIANDPWLAGRHFGIVIDAGSSGSRMQIYSWKDPRLLAVEKGSPLAFKLPKVEKGTKNDDLWVTKVDPGLSTLADNPEEVGAYLRPLLKHARDHIPPSLHKDTPLFLLATAGMRLLSPQKQAAILQETCSFLTLHSDFKIEGPSDSGPCGSSVRIITGEEEGLFGWIAVNYLMDGFSGSSDDQTTYGFLDMGGASTQIAFEPSFENQKLSKNLIDVRLRLLGGEEIHHKVFVTTWLGYGTNQARERYVGKVIEEYDSSLDVQVDDYDVEHSVPDPCLPQGLELSELPMHITTPASKHLMDAHRLVGTGSFEKCLENTAPLLNTTTPCPDTPCLMNGIQVPPIDFSVSHFIGVSEYWYSSEHIFGLGGAYDFVQYERAASEFCSRDWKSIMQEHEESRRLHRLGGDGEVLKDGKVVEAGKWSPQVELPRLQMQCFKAAWIANVLHEGIKLPRIVDPGGNLSTEGGNIEIQAKKKGLGKPTFQSMDSVGDIAISWTLGKIVLEASKEVPPIKGTMKPIVDPIDDIVDIEHFPIQPIRPPFLSFHGIEEKLTPHLPYSLTRDSLGFSPVPFLFYSIVVLFLFFLVYPLRRRLRTSCLRTMRVVAKREPSPYADLMEEGHLHNGWPPPPSSTGGFLNSIRRIFGFPRPVKSLTNSNNHILRHIIPNGGSSSNSRDPLAVPQSLSLDEIPPFGTSTQYMSRSPSPAAAAFDESSLTLLGGQSSLTSRSRNASQVNLLTSLTSTRAVSISRSNSQHLGHGKFATE